MRHTWIRRGGFVWAKCIAALDAWLVGSGTAEAAEITEDKTMNYQSVYSRIPAN